MEMRTVIRLTLFVMLLAVLAVATSNAMADEIATTDAIAGTWYGNMHFSNRNSIERIQLVIPAGCEPGSVCGSLLNYPVQCVWEITYDGFANGAYQYHFSGTLKGDCPAGTSGSLTLLRDGSLYRVHTTPIFTAAGTLEQRANAGN